MRTASVLVTGANGEIGHGLITRLASTGRPIVTIDIAPLEPGLARLVRREFTGSITDTGLLERVLSEFEIDLVFHLAALLSTRSEFTPITAHHVNVEGTLNLLEFAHHEGESHGRPVVFLYPSSIAAYGLPDADTKARARRVREDEWNVPTTMYGCNKLYCEHLGRYYARHYKQLAADSTAGRVDFRCVRFPGLISALTSPSGGTSDYAPEMIHAAARGEPYACFVRPDTRIPFMTMPDAIEALLRLASVQRERLTRTAYNLTAFSPTAEQICDVVTRAFAGARITWSVDEKRQRIVDSWPADVDDSAARRDWNFEPRFDFERAFDEYLIPTIQGSAMKKLVAGMWLLATIVAGAQGSTMNTLGERYVRLVLAMGQHDADYVDAYYGPPEWRSETDAAKIPLAEIEARASALARELSAAAPQASAEELIRLRHAYVSRQLEALRARASMLMGRKLAFDEESKALYDAVAPVHGAAEFQRVLDELDKKLPGQGPLIQRYDEFRSGFVIPKDRLDATFKAAIDGCRSRTLQHITLPAGESFTVEYVTGKSWSGYNWYQGNYRSLIQVNTDLPIYIDRAIDLACHEGYPGHHVYNVLLEKNLVRDRGWTEFTVYPLFSPQSLIAEGTANYGIDVAFPRAERLEFERRVVFPTAQLNSERTVQYYDVLALVDRLSYAGNEAARRYLNGEIDRNAAIDWLERYGLYTRPRAEQRLRFIEQYRSYVINYNLGKDLVAAHIEARGGTPSNPGKRWEEFTALISSPRLPSGLAAK